MNNVVLYEDPIPFMVTMQALADIIYNTEPVDLVLVMGTSLQVAPFCAIPNLVPKTCTRALIDRNPENAFTNDWSPNKQISGISNSSSIKFGIRHRVSLRPQWNTRRKWKSQYIIKCDTDEWAEGIMNI